MKSYIVQVFAELIAYSSTVEKHGCSSTMTLTSLTAAPRQSAWLLSRLRAHLRTRSVAGRQEFQEALPAWSTLKMQIVRVKPNRYGRSSKVSPSDSGAAGVTEEEAGLRSLPDWSAASRAQPAPLYTTACAPLYHRLNPVHPGCNPVLCRLLSGATADDAASETAASEGEPVLPLVSCPPAPTP